MTHLGPKGTPLWRRALRAVSAITVAILVAGAGTAIGITAAQATPNAALTLIPGADATTPHNQFDPFSYTFDYACTSGSGATTCDDMVITVPITLEPHAGQAELFDRWTFDLALSSTASTVFEQSWAKTDTGATLTLTARQPINAGVQETFVVTVTPARWVGDGTRFTVGDATLTTSNGDPARSGSYTSTVTNRPLADPVIAATGGYRTGSGTQVVNYTLNPNLMHVLNQGGGSHNYSLVRQFNSGTPGVTAFADTIDVRLPLPAGATPAALGSGVSYDAATHSLVFTSGLNSPMPGANYVFSLEYPASMDGQSVTLTGTRDFTATNGDEHSTPFAVTHGLDYRVLSGGVVGKCGAGLFASAYPRVEGACNNNVALTHDWALPVGTGPAQSGAVNSGSYVITVGNVQAGDTVHLTDAMPCLDTPTGSSVAESFGSQAICANPALRIVGFSANITPIGQGSGVQIYNAAYTVTSNNGQLTDSRTALNANPYALNAGSWQSFDLTIPNIQYTGALKINVNVATLPSANRDMLLENTDAHLELFHAGESEPALEGTTPVGVLRVEDLVVASASTSLGALSGNQAYFSSAFTVQGLNPTSGYPVYTIALPMGFQLTAGDLTALKFTVGGSGTTHTALDSFDIRVVPEDTSVNTPARLVMTQKPGQLGPVPGEGWPKVTFNGYLEPTWGALYTQQSITAAVSVAGSGNAIDRCSAGTLNANDPSDRDLDTLTAGDTSCERVVTATLGTPSPAASGVAAKSVRDTATGEWVAGNSRTNILSDEMEYRIVWTNAGQPTLNDVVLYDVFPFAGDTGTTSLTAGTSRGSTYAPVFAGLSSTVPSGMAVAYSASENPCRPEVRATNPGCANDWVADPAALGGNANVKALRLTLAGAQTTGKHYALSFIMTVPESASSQDVAWNTVAHRAVLNGTPMNPAETARTGAFLPSNVFVSKALTRTENGDYEFRVGDTLTYVLHIENLYGSGMENVQISDDLSAVLGVGTYNFDESATSGTVTFDSDTNTLHWVGDVAPRETVTITYSVTTTSIATNGVVNRVVGTSNEEPTNCVTGEEPECSATGTIFGPPAVNIDKVAPATPENTAVLPGTLVNWEYIVTNTGWEDLHTVVVTDNRRGVTVSCPETVLPVGASMTCIGQGRVAGDPSYSNTGTVTAISDLTEQSVADSDVWSVPILQLTPELEVVKTAAGVVEGSQLEPNQLVTWNYTVTNTGTDSFETISVGDDRGVRVVCPNPVNLEPGDSVTCTGTGRVGYAATYVNVATATGIGWFSGGTATDTDDWSATVRQQSVDVQIDKVARGVAEGGAVRPGTTITWEYIVTNSGEEPIGKIVVTDDQGVVVSCPAEELAPGASMTCTGSGSVGEGDSYTNIGTVTGATTLTETPVTAEDPWSVEVVAAIPGLSITKGAANAVDGGSVLAGTTVNWNYTVQNTGTERIVNLVVTDDQGVAITCPVTELAVGEIVTCTGSAVIGDGGTYTNVGTATGEGEESDDPAEDEDEWTTDVEEPTTEVVIIKNSTEYESGTRLAEGTTVTWEYTVTNTGSENLVHIVVTDNMGVEVGCPATTLAPGESMVCTGTGSVGTGDRYTNIGSITAVGEVTGNPAEEEDTWTAILVPPTNDEPGNPVVVWPHTPVGGAPVSSAAPGLALTGGSSLAGLSLLGLGTLIAGATLLLARRRRVPN